MLLCDVDSEFSGQQELLQSTEVEVEAELPEGQLLRKYGLRFPDAASVRPSVMKVDPAISKLCELKAALSSSQVILQSYATEENVLQGLNSTKGIRGTISHWLSEITGDSVSHLQVARRKTYTLYDILPNTWASAVINVAKSQGFAPELFHLGLVSNLSFMDHNQTKLRVKGPSDQDAIISDIAVVLGNTAGSKKSHMESILKRLVPQHPEIQNENIPRVALGNGTIKGVRMALESKVCNHHFF